MELFYPETKSHGSGSLVHTINKDMSTRTEHLKVVSLWGMRKVEIIEEFYKRKLN